jgi:small conductance mechanosensitive channel
MDNFWLTIDKWISQHDIWNKLIGWLAAYVPNMIFAIIIFVVGRWIARIVSNIIEKALRRAHVDVTLSTFAKHLIYASILVFFIVAAMGKLGIETASFAVVIGAAGLAIGLALQGSLSNFAAGVLLIIFKPVKVGDFVEIAGTKGTVTEVEVFNTIINTPDNIRTIIPNSHVTGANISNYTANGTRRVDLVFGISYENDIRKARLVIMDVLTKEKRVLPDPEPFVGVLELAESGINLAVRPWVKVADYWDVFFALNENIKLALEAAGMTIPFRQVDVHLVKDEPVASSKN